MQKILTPNVMQFLGGVVAVLIGALVLKGTTEGMGLVGLGVFAMGNAIKSPGHVMQERAAEKRRSSMPPPDPINVPVEGPDSQPPTIPDRPAVKPRVPR